MHRKTLYFNLVTFPSCNSPPDLVNDLSKREISLHLTPLRRITSLRRDGGRGSDIMVGVWRAVCLGGRAGTISPTSENKSPRSVEKNQTSYYALGRYTKSYFSSAARVN